ncbi:uncharacterized protein F4807DRAFT_471795 [Annulohypoxylon truncatum]|uniref:uncharacterized protein n=1 Tax=Annulohypoxylon truncatum TaxID=327061 RepID=UPI00200754DF|nr:uncharacterized protein F4807DRAFT_471795 [Annulohypoxylon truncatum]KAI1204742.1 hypothetical protein F4807DRAFT_471795 [Annulohypoxylon truncatum]
MKFLNFIILGSLATFTSADGGYASHCKNMTLVNENNQAGLRAYCEGSSGGSQCSILPLNLCYSSDAGIVKPQDRGDLSKRCPPKRAKLNSTILSSGCHKWGSRKTHLMWTDVDTNELIISENGILKCFGNRALTPPDCEQRPAGSGTEGNDVPIVLVAFLCILLPAIMLW